MLRPAPPDRGLGVGALISFRFVTASLFNVIFGDRGDGRLIIYLHEQGRADFPSPPMFYPQKYVLGFSDALCSTLRPMPVNTGLRFSINHVIVHNGCLVNVRKGAHRFFIKAARRRALQQQSR